MNNEKTINFLRLRKSMGSSGNVVEAIKKYQARRKRIGLGVAMEFVIINSLPETNSLPWKLANGIRVGEFNAWSPGKEHSKRSN